eukprot:Partr_v1_DN27523_c2_g1_i1_m30071 putative Mechanosensitive ion channel
MPTPVHPGDDKKPMPEIVVVEMDTDDEQEKMAKKKKESIREEVKMALGEEREKTPKILRFLRWFAKWPMSARTIVHIILGAIPLLAPGIVDYLFFLDRANGEGKSLFALSSSAEVGGYSVFSWSMYFTIIWAVLMGSKYIISVIPAMVLRIVDLVLGKYYVEVFRPRLDYIRLLNVYLAWLVTSIVALVLRAVAFNGQRSDIVLLKILQCVLVASILMLIQKFWLKVIAVSFHRKAYRDRLIKSKFMQYVIDLLFSAKKAIMRAKFNNNIASSSRSNLWSSVMNAGSSFSGPSSPTRKHKKRPATTDNQDMPVLSSEEQLMTEAVENQKSETSPVSVADDDNNNGKSKPHKFFAQSFNLVSAMSEVTGVNAVIRGTTGVVKGVTRAAFSTIMTGSASDTDLQTDEQAQQLAHEIFMAFKEDTEGELKLNDFMPFFATAAEAEQAFALMDIAENGGLNMSEFTAFMVSFYNNKRALEQGLRDLGETLGRLDSMMMSVVVVVLMLICLSIFDVGVEKYLVTAGSFVVAASFIIGSSAKSVFESVIFVFSYHPYDTGDKVMIDDVIYIIKSLELTTTTFERLDGQEVYMHNTIVAQKVIHNFRRSGDQAEMVTISIPLSTSQEKVLELEKRMRDFVNANHRDYHPGLDFYVDGINGRDLAEMKATIVLKMGINHKANWQDFGAKVKRRNKFHWELKQHLNQLDIYFTVHPDEKAVKKRDDDDDGV